MSDDRVIVVVIIIKESSPRKILKNHHTCITREADNLHEKTCAVVPIHKYLSNKHISQIS